MNGVNQGGAGTAGVSGQKTNKSERLSPGEILHEGRLAHDYSIEDLCVQTKLSAATVRALEDNDFQALSQPVFARGYYRQCAKVLDLDVNRLMTAYYARAGEPTIAKIYQRQKGAGRGPRRLTPGGFRDRRLAILLGVGLAAIVLIVFVFPSGRMAGNLFNRSASNDQDRPNAAVSPHSSPAATGDDIALAEKPSTNRVSSAPHTVSAAGGGSSQHAATGAPAGGQSVKRSVSRGPAEGANDSRRPPGSDDKPRSPPTALNNRLVLVFSKRCWTSVTDANGHRLARGIFKAGDKKILNGTPPYTIYLGFAPGVKVSIGGHPVDVSSRAHQSVAHLTVHAPDG